MTDWTKVSIIAGSIGGALGAVWCVFAERKYRRSRKILAKVKAAEVESIVDATSLAKNGSYDGFVSGKIEALDKNATVFRETKPRVVSLWSSGESLAAGSVTGSSFAIKEGNGSVMVSPGQGTKSFGLKREMTSHPPIVLILEGVSVFFLELFWPHMTLGNYEYFAYDGQHITLFGTLAYNTVKSQLEMTKAKFMFSGSKKDIENYLGAITNGDWWGAKIAETITGICLFVALYGGYQKVKSWYVERREKRHMDLLQQKLAQLNVVDPDGNFKCVICYDNVKNVVYRPCNHLATCAVCDSKLNEQVCPMCRRHIDGRTIIALQ